jgi:ATP:ADP antiporter, AAA family
MVNYLRGLLPLKQGEGIVTALMFFYVFGVLTLYYILEPLRSGLFLKNVPSSQLPYMYFLIAIVAGTIAVITFQLSRRVSAISLLTGSNLVIFGTLFYFRLAMEQQIWYLPYVFYVYVKILSVLSTAQFWLLAGYIYDNRQAKRIYSVLGVGASLGAVAGSTVPAFLSQRLSTESMLMVCMAISLVLIVLSQIAWRYRRTDAEVKTRSHVRQASNEKLASPWSMILGSRHLSLMVLLIFLTLITSQVADWQLMDAVQKRYQTSGQPAAIGSFFGWFNLVTNTLTIVVQFLATGFVVNRLGILATIIFLPAGLLLTSAGIFLYPSILTAALARGTDMIARYTVNRAGLEMLYLPMAATVRKKLKLFLDVFVDRTGRAVAGVVILVFTSSYFPYGLRGTAAMAMVLTFLCVLACLQLRKTYVDAFRQQLIRREIELGDVSHYVGDPAAVGLLVGALEGANERQILYSLQLLQSVRSLDFSAQLLPLLEHSSAHVREEAVRTLQALPQDHTADAERMLDDSAGEVRTAVIDYLCLREAGGPLGRLELLFSHDNHDIRLAAARWAAAHPVPGFLPPADFIGGLLAVRGSGGPEARAAAAALAVYLPEQGAIELLRQLLDDPAPSVAAAAAIAAGKAGHLKLVFNLINMLPLRQVRTASREGLLYYGNRIVGTLGDLLSDKQCELAVRHEIPWVLSRIPVKRSWDLLIENLAAEDELLRFRCVKALNRLHETNPTLRIPDAVIKGRIHAETRAYYEALAISHAIGLDTDIDATRLLGRALREHLDQKLEIIFRLLGLAYPQKDIYSAYTALKGIRADRRSAGLELLDNVLPNNLKSIILPLLEEPSAAVLVERANSVFQIEISSREDALRALLGQADNWLATCALHEIGFGMKNMTIIERVLLLQGVDLFSNVTTHQLSFIAAIAEELPVEAGTVLYHENDAPDGLYVVISGAVMVNRNGDEIERIAPNGALGVWAVFDDQPRLTGAEVTETSRLLFVPREEFYEVLADHVEIVQGIFKQLVQRVRSVAAVA